MKATIEIKKITTDPKTMMPTVNVEFTLGHYDDVKEFKKKLIDFHLNIEGQKKLTR